jgi:Flp pilus assembly protein TadB
MGSEIPGSVTKGPPITVTCECGERRELFYGERWTCPACGRAYDSRNIPEAEYAAIRRLQLRFRALPIALGVVIAGLAILFTLTDNIVGVFFLMPVGTISWFVFIRPTHRRRYREAIADLPHWDLRADGP